MVKTGSALREPAIRLTIHNRSQSLGYPILTCYNLAPCFAGQPCASTFQWLALKLSIDVFHDPLLSLMISSSPPLYKMCSRSAGDYL